MIESVIQEVNEVVRGDGIVDVIKEGIGVV